MIEYLILMVRVYCANEFNCEWFALSTTEQWDQLKRNNASLNKFHSEADEYIEFKNRGGWIMKIITRPITEIEARKFHSIFFPNGVFEMLSEMDYMALIQGSGSHSVFKDFTTDENDNSEK